MAGRIMLSFIAAFRKAEWSGYNVAAVFGLLVTS
jgi:hypothetical protein